MHTFETLLRTVNQWVDEESVKPRAVRQRLGQWLMNRLEPKTVDAEVFYEENAKKAYLLFEEKYCARNHLT